MTTVQNPERSIMRPQVQVVEYDNMLGAYTFQVIFKESVRTFKGTLSKDEAKQNAKAFADWFDKEAKLIETGQERPHPIFRSVADKFHSEYTPKPRVETPDFLK